MKKWSLLFIGSFLSWVLPGPAADVGSLRWSQVFQTSPTRDGRVVIVYRAVRVGDRYLAVVLGTFQSPEGKERLRKSYGSPTFLAPAWFSTQWQLLHLGDPLFAAPVELNPGPLAGWEPSLLDPLGFPRYPVHRFPKVLVRMAGAAWCPYLIVTTTQIACLDESLRLGPHWEIPFQGMDVFSWQEAIWIAGYHDGFLLHEVRVTDEGHGPYEIRPARIVRSVGTLHDLKTFLEKRGYSSADLRDLDPSTWDLFVQLADKNRKKMTENPQKLESLMRKDPKGRRYLPFGLHASLRPFHLPMAATAQGDRAYVVLHRPFGVVVVGAEGSILDFWPIRREDLPPSIRNYSRPAVWDISLARDRLFINVRLERDIPYQELRTVDPAAAARLAEQWDVISRQRCSDIVPCGRPLTPETVTGTEHALYGFEMTKRGTIDRVYSLDVSDGQWFRWIAPVFFPTPDEMWMPVRTTEYERGVARMIW
jgi:hypothetical protein